MIRFRPPVLALALILSGSWPAAKPFRDSSVFRGALPDRPGLIFMALHPEMTAAYDGKTGVLFQATHPVNGLVYHRQSRLNLWSVRNIKGVVSAKPKFDKVIQVEGHTALRTILRLPEGRKITIVEMPGFDNHYGDNALLRNITITGIPPGYTVTLALSGDVAGEIWGGGGMGQLSESKEGKWSLIQSQDGESPLKVTWPGPKTESEKAPF